MQKSLSDSTTVANQDKQLTQALEEVLRRNGESGFETAELPEIIRSDYSQSPGKLVLGHELLIQLGDKDLIEYVKKEPTKRRLDAALITSAYLSRAKDDSERIKIKQLLEKTSPDDMITLLSMELAGKLSPEEERRILNLKLSSELSPKTEPAKEGVNKLGDFELMGLEGKLGKGLSIRNQGSYIEHRTPMKGCNLRIYMKDGEYNAVLHFDEISMKKNSYAKYDSLVSIVNNIFKTGFSPNLKDFISSSEGEYYKLDSSPNGRDFINPKVGVKINFKDYHFDERRVGGYNGADDYVANLLSGAFAIIGTLSSIPLYVFNHPYIGGAISLLALSGGINAFSSPFDREKFGIIQRKIMDYKRTQMKKKELTSMKSFEEVGKKFNKLVSGPDAMNDFERFKRGSEELSDSYNNLTSNFSRLSDCKGYVVCFKDRSLEEVYNKAYRVIQSIEANAL